MAIPTPGLFAVCASTTYPVVATGASWVNLRLTDADVPVPEHIGRGEDRQGRTWVKVPKTALQRYFKVVVTVEWQGEEFGLSKLSGDTAEILGGSPPVAARLGLDGDQYNGFHATVPVEELRVVGVSEREIDV